MKEVTVGSKYQIVIPKEIRKKISGIKPGTKMIIKPLNKKTITIKKVERDWAERTVGIAKEDWENIDTTQYLEDLRNEWDKKS